MADSKNPSLRELVAAPVAVSVGGRELMLQPMGWYQASIAMQPLLPVLQAMPAIGEEIGDRSADRVALWAGMVISFKDEIAEFCAQASGFPLDEVKALQPAHMVELVMALVEVNADFFAQSLPGLLQGAQGRLARLMERWAPMLAAAAAAAPDSTTSSSG